MTSVLPCYADFQDRNGEKHPKIILEVKNQTSLKITTIHISNSFKKLSEISFEFNLLRWTPIVR